ncbi:MAG: IS1634 family transposase [Bacteroidales bacterium]|nr:IS1634 family transposase [Bacteroidales bacterium]MCF8406185.1 IS1634 family transposase [Bacteroidales bacterium]
MLRIRVIKTASGANAVQVVYYRNRKRVVFKHIGSAKSIQELESLKLVAQDVISNFNPEIPLFEEAKLDNLLYLDKSEFLGVYFTFLYEVISDLLSQIGLDKIKKQLLLDLVAIRVVEPASKLRSIELLDTYFGIKHRRQSYYQSAPQWLVLKEKIESIVVDFAKKNYAFNFDLLFYDVTTLYFETFEEDELRRNGFSKDNKSQQPQILVALLVTKEGFPIEYDIFSGNTFEGHTIIPVVNNFIKKHAVKDFTIVADAAMISTTNTQELLKNNINYIVGARLGNLPNELIERIDSSITREDGRSIRIKTGNGYLVCSYSSVRYRKDKHEMEKQIQRAKAIIETPSKGKKVKFIKTSGEQVELNQALVEKSKKLLGIKGYYTNLDESTVSNQTIIERYHELYRVEQAFRISKHDLQTRPIFHFKEEPINLHILICFMALVVSKHIELATGESIRKFITECKKVTVARMLNKITNKEIRIKTKYNDKILKYLKSLNLPH